MKRPENHWMSISDLMSGLMIVFLFVSVAFMIQLQDQEQERKETIRQYAIIKHELYEDLREEFAGDLEHWDAEIDEEKLSITFKEPDTLFKTGSSELSPSFQIVLDDFVPRYIKVLTQDKYRNEIEEVRIEGHTSPEWNGQVGTNEEYFKNMELSQARTRSVLQYVIIMPKLQPERDWLIKHITANGLSSSQPIINPATGLADPERSRRVEFRLRTNADEKMKLLIKKEEGEDAT